VGWGVTALAIATQSIFVSRAVCGGLVYCEDPVDWSSPRGLAPVAESAVAGSGWASGEAFGVGGVDGSSEGGDFLCFLDFDFGGAVAVSTQHCTAFAPLQNP